MINDSKSNEFYTNKKNLENSHYHDQKTGNFDRFRDTVPEKPDMSRDNSDYLRQLQKYELQMHFYFYDRATELLTEFARVDSLTERHKQAYYTLNADYKSLQKYVDTMRNNYTSFISDSAANGGNNDGSMSPSNPCYTMFVDEDEDETNENRSEETAEVAEGDCEAHKTETETEIECSDRADNENCYLTLFRNQMKNVRKYIRREKRKIKTKKLSKNQKKKLKKKLKNDTTNTLDNGNKLEIDNYVNIDSIEDPQIMIQQFFKSYSERGEWSWTDWFSCVSRIQQRFPEWFEVFSQFSNGMGINWNEMFMSDVQAIDLSNVRIDIRNVQAVSSGISCTGNNAQHGLSSPSQSSREGKSVIFTEDIEPVAVSTNESSQSELFCDSCKQEFKSNRAFHIHLRGVKHIQNEIKHVSQQKPEIFIEEIDRENASIMNDTNKEEKHLQWLLTNEDCTKGTGTYTCTVCDISCSSQKAFNLHLNGEKHKTRMASGSTVKSSICDDSKTEETKIPLKSIKKPVAIIQRILNQCTQPLIGLNYINEYQRLNECCYYCDLCYSKFDRKSIIPHIMSYNHRKTYLKQNYYELYELIEQDTNAKSVKIKRLEVYSEQIEIFEGRKKINIYSEKLSNNNNTSESSSVAPNIISENSLSNNAEVLSGNTNCKIDVNEQQSLCNKEPSKNMSSNDDEVDDCNDEDKEDGEVESSDEESSLSRSQSVNNKQIVVIVEKNEQPAKCDIELEAGEIETDIIELDKGDSDDNMETEDCIGLCSNVETAKRSSNKSEFDNYEPVFVNDRPPINSTESRLEFMRHNKERKTVKLKEVTPDILNHFKQEVIWALNRARQTNNVSFNNNNNRSLLLPPSKVPIGPIYPGVSELSTRSLVNNIPTHSSDESNRFSSPETDLSNMIDNIESTYGPEITANRFTDNNIRHDVQNMLVNKSKNDRLNEAVRKELLFPPEISNQTTNSSNKSNRKYILSDPIDVKVLNECVDLLMNMSERNKFNANKLSAQLDKKSKHYRSDQSIKMGVKMSNHYEFLGADQPPPPNFTKIEQEMYSEPPPNFGFLSANPIPPLMPPYFTPGMIEHPSAFSNYSGSFFYHYPYLSTARRSSQSHISSSSSNRVGFL